MDKLRKHSMPEFADFVAKLHEAFGDATIATRSRAGRRARRLSPHRRMANSSEQI